MAEPKRLPNGRWKIRYRDPEGRPRSKVCDTKAEARAIVEEVAQAGGTGCGSRRSGGGSPWPSGPGGTCPPWSTSGPRRSCSTSGNWFTSKTPIGKLEPLAIQTWLASLLAGGMASSSVHRKYRFLRRILQVAVEARTDHPEPRLRRATAAGRDQRIRVLNPEALVRLVESIEPRVRPFVYTAAETGMAGARSSP